MVSMCGSILRGFYAVSLLSNMLLAVALMKLVHLLPLSKAKREGYSLVLLQASWRFSIMLSPWIQCSQVKSDPWADCLSGTDVKVTREGSSEPFNRPVFVLSNHTSFFDTIFSLTALPVGVAYNIRTYMKETLFNMPVLGTVSRCVGHFAVRFVAGDGEGFSVDDAFMKQEDAKVAAHIMGGGFLCFFPEGQINKNPDKLTSLRHGGFKRSLEYDAKLVALVCCGNPDVWPRQASVGGFPGRVTYSVKTITPGGCRAFTADLRKKAVTPEESAKPDFQLLAEAVEAMMQGQYDQTNVLHKEKCGELRDKSD